MCDLLQTFLHMTMLVPPNSWTASGRRLHVLGARTAQHLKHERPDSLGGASEKAQEERKAKLACKKGSMHEMIAATPTTTTTASTTPTIPCGLRNCDIGRRYATDVFRRGCDVCRQHTNHRHEATGRSTNRPEFSESSSTFRRDPRRRTRDASSPSSWMILPITTTTTTTTTTRSLTEIGIAVPGSIRCNNRPMP